jgi:hypothetical protein
LKDLYLETCCQNKYLTRREYVEEEMKKEAIYSKKEVTSRAQIFLLLRSPRIDSKEPIPPGCVA